MVTQSEVAVKRLHLHWLSHQGWKLGHLGNNVSHFMSVGVWQHRGPVWGAKELEWLEEEDFSLLTYPSSPFWRWLPRTLRKNKEIKHWKKGFNNPCGTNKLSFRGKKFWKVLILSPLEVKNPTNPLAILSLYPKAFPDDSAKRHASGKLAQRSRCYCPTLSYECTMQSSQ